MNRYFIRHNKKYKHSKIIGYQWRGQQGMKAQAGSIYLLRRQENSLRPWNNPPRQTEVWGKSLGRTGLWYSDFQKLPEGLTIN